MTRSLCKLKIQRLLSAVVLATLPLMGCSAERKPPSTSALDVRANEPTGKSKAQLTQLSEEEKIATALRPLPFDSYLGKISPGIFNQLKYLPLIAPAYIPDSFLLVQYDIPNAGYSLIYRNPSEQCFAIEYDSSKGLNDRRDTVEIEPSSQVDLSAPVASDPAQITPAQILTAQTENTQIEQPLNQSDSDTSSQSATDPTDASFANDLSDFKTFDSPLFGSEKKLFYGDAARSIALMELAAIQAETTPLDLLAADTNRVAGTSQSTGQSAGQSAGQVTASTDANSAVISGKSLVSQWLKSDGGAYRYISGAIVTQNYPDQTQCASVSVEESVKIMTSLADLTAEPADTLESNLTDPFTVDSSQN